MDSELKNVILSALFKPLGGLRKQILDIDGTDDKQPGLLIDEWIREKGLHDRISFVFEPEGENCGPSDSNNFRVAAKAEDFIVPGSHAASKDHTSNALLNIFSDVLLPDREKPQPSFFQADVVGTTFPYPTSQRPTPNLAELWKKFEVDFDKIKHNPGINAVLMLFEKHFSGLPYGAFEDTPVSIYQFAKISAALAASIYNFLQDNPKETLNDSDNMYLLIGADVSGVQDFIYTIYSTGALKNLRARSFYLEILTEKVAHEIIDQLRISSANIIYSGGGGFLMLAQNTEKSRKAIAALQADINKWLLDKFETKLYFNIECEEFSGDDLYEPSGGGAEYPFSVVYRMLSEKIEKSKSNKFSDSLEAVLTPKMPTNLSGYCPVCHTDDKRLGDGGKGIKICRFCSNFAKISTRLIGKGEYRFIHERAYDDDADFTIMKSHYKFSKIAAPKGKSFVINSWDVNDWVNGDEWQLLIGNYSSGCDELEQLAKKSDGKNLIGALRMDVDNLGMIFITGLSTKSIFRMAELSQRLTLFFKYYINVICKGDIDDVYCVKPSVSKSSRPVDIIYAGGDDLFILGAWDQTAEIAFDIQKAFAKYTGNNPSVTLSGGVTLHKHNYPVYQMAQMSKEAESEAKNNERDGKEKGSVSLFYNDLWKHKNAILRDGINKKNNKGWSWGKGGIPEKIISQASFWDEAERDLFGLTKELMAGINWSRVSHGFFYRLFKIVEIWQIDGVFFLPALDYVIKKSADQLGPGALGLLSKLQPQDMPKLATPLTWIEYLHRKGG